jgi:hypothetical protein
MSEEKRPEDREDVTDANAFGSREIAPALKAFEAALASLVPRADRLDRDRLMFLAGQQSRVSTAHQYQSGAGLRSWWAKPTLRIRSTWAWPAAFSAMATVAAVLAILLAIRPAVPSADSSRDSAVVSAKDQKPPRDVPARETSFSPPESEINDRVQPLSPLLTFLQSFWKAGDASNGEEAAAPAPESLASSYPRLRRDMLRRGSESQVARNFTGSISAGVPESSANRELLKQYLPDSN